MNKLKAGVLFYFFISFYCQAQSVDKIVNDLAIKIRENYILDNEAVKMHALLLKNLEAGNYSQLNGSVLAEKLQSDLRAVFNDKHLSIRYNGERRNSNPKISRNIPFYPHAISQAKILDGNIGYIEITGFREPNPKLRNFLAGQMASLHQTKAIIIDIRNNGGGSPASVQLICSYFFSEDAKILLNSLYFRNRNFKRDFYTLQDIPGPRITELPLFVVTSNYTFSGAEEFAYNLKNLKRATIVGEITGGGAHPVDAFSLPGGFTAIIPVGRAINPITGTNWEGTGVEPHHIMDEGKALDWILKKN